ncbi:TPA: MBL fold metallo-hydrolase [Staphylococcus aureus]|nr:MBL fold metallo-hydrolase [Staphylococcus aureus]
MNIRHIRNATAVIEYGGKRVLIDPMLSDKGAFEPFPNSPRQDENNPLVELPLAIEVLPKDIKIYTQNEADASEVEGYDFTNVSVFNDVTHIGEIELIKTDAQHGHGEILKMTGHVHGLVLKHSEEPTLYLAADTVWFDGVEKTLKAHHPDIIVLNGGANQFFEGGPLVMDEHDVLKVAHTLSLAQIVVVNMEAVNHWHLSREELNEFINSNDLGNRVVVPNDGELLTFEK